MNFQRTPYLRGNSKWEVCHVMDATGNGRWSTNPPTDEIMKILFPNTYPVITEVCRKVKQASLNTSKIYFSPQNYLYFTFSEQWLLSNCVLHLIFTRYFMKHQKRNGSTQNPYFTIVKYRLYLGYIALQIHRLDTWRHLTQLEDCAQHCFQLGGVLSQGSHNSFPLLISRSGITIAILWFLPLNTSYPGFLSSISCTLRMRKTLCNVGFYYWGESSVTRDPIYMPTNHREKRCGVIT